MATVIGIPFADATTNKDLLKEGSLRTIFDNTVHDANKFSEKFYNMENTNLWIETDFRMAGFDLAPEIAEGQNIPIQKPQAGTTKSYTQRIWGTGFRMTKWMNEANKYKLWSRWAKSLGEIMTETKDIELAVPFNSPTSTTLTCGTGFDSLAVGYDTHTGLNPNTTSDNYDNYINAALSYTSLDSARYYFAMKENDMGLHMGMSPDTLYFEPTQYFTAVELTQSTNRPFEFSNTTNKPIQSMGLELYEYKRLTSTTAWGMAALKDKNHDFNCFTFQAPQTYTKDAPDHTLDRVMIAVQAFTYGWGHPATILIGKT